MSTIRGQAILKLTVKAEGGDSTSGVEQTAIAQLTDALAAVT